MKIKKMLERLKKEDYVKYFNQIIREDWWSRTSLNEPKHNLLAAIPALIKSQHYLIEHNLKTLYVKKLGGNYNYIPCKLKTNLCSTPTTKDHIVGVKRIGDIVWSSIEEESLTIDNYKDWIYDNLFIWGRVDMTKKEHKSVEVNPRTLLDNVRFNHYPKPLQKEIIEKIKKKLREFKKV